jgi:hypothetical protein
MLPLYAFNWKLAEGLPRPIPPFGGMRGGDGYHFEPGLGGGNRYGPRPLQ